MAQKPRIPKGTRDFSPVEVSKRNFLFDVIKRNFEIFGFQPIETPSFELSETLLGKYGEEGDRLIFKILNSGDFLKKVDDSVLESGQSNVIAQSISEKALRYDLTVPFARYVVQHQNDITFPFKRYQIQPVWRADRPQKGRFREFFQCDADVVGSQSLWQEVEFVQLYDAVFADLNLNGAIIKINNRKVLYGIAEVIGAEDKLLDFTIALDKLDKIGEENVKDELRAKGFEAAVIEKLQPLFNMSGSFTDQLENLTSLLDSSSIGQEGIEELKFINTSISEIGLRASQLELDVTLARGLNYYTGTIYEVAPPQGVQMGSIGGGGRYDDLTGIFGLKNVSGIGISFGLDRIYLVMEELNLFPESVTDSVEVLFINFGSEEAFYCLKLISQLRDQGISAELYPDAVKMNKQMTYANRREIPNVVLIGKDELQNNTLTLKNMKTGDQQKIKANQLLTALK